MGTLLCRCAAVRALYASRPHTNRTPCAITSRSGTSTFCVIEGTKNIDSPEPNSTTSGAYSVRMSSQCQKDKKQNKTKTKSVKVPWHSTVLKYPGVLQRTAATVRRLCCVAFFTEEQERSQPAWLVLCCVYMCLCASKKETETEHPCHGHQHQHPPPSPSPRAEASSYGSSCALQDCGGARLPQS